MILSRRLLGAGGADASTQAYIAAMTTPPDGTRQGLIEDLITGLKEDGVWSKLDWLSILAAHDAQAARINAVTPTDVATVVGSPTFTTDRGYTGVVSSGYLNSGYNPSTDAVNFAQNSAHMGVWVGTNVNNSSQYDLGNSRATIVSRNTGGTTLVSFANSPSNNNSTISATSIGHSAWYRNNSSTFRVFRNGTNLNEPSQTSAAPANEVFLICAGNFNPTVSGSSRRIQAVHWGAALTDTQMTAMYNRLNTYMTAVGAV